jgi:RHS repeat-associated protein
LINATGREHLGQTNNQLNAPQQPTHDDGFRTKLLHRGDGNAMGNYAESYQYDEVGNILKMLHTAQGVVGGGWTRNYQYDPGSNRLLLTSNPSGSLSDAYAHDVHGNMIKMPHLTLMEWDFKDQFHATSRQVVTNGTPETTWYVYDSSGQRVRKVTDNSAESGQTPSRKAERIYLGGFELYREYGSNGSAVTLERETLHIMDDKRRIALVETKTVDVGAFAGTVPDSLTRYQFSNHLGSASLEVDQQAKIISYEEYFPYGSTSYQAVRNKTETPKRYRYTAKERDEETGFYYHGARYYAPWLGTWTSADPIGFKDGVNLYGYVKNNPTNAIDLNGMQSGEPGKSQSEKIKSPKLVLDPQYQKQEEIKAERFTKVPEELKRSSPSPNGPSLTPYNPQDETQLRGVKDRIKYATSEDSPRNTPDPAHALPVSLPTAATSAGNTPTPPIPQKASNAPPIPAAKGGIEMAVGMKLKGAKAAVNTKGDVSGGYGDVSLSEGKVDLAYGSYSTKTETASRVESQTVGGTVMNLPVYYEQTTKAIGVGLPFLNVINSQTELRKNGELIKQQQQRGFSVGLQTKIPWLSFKVTFLAPPVTTFQKLTESRPHNARYYRTPAEFDALHH